MEFLQAPGFLLAAGLLAGGVIGYVARRRHFCTMAALERQWYAGDSRGVRTWALAAGVAMVLTQTLMLTGIVDLRESFYLQPFFGLTGAVIGGIAFGFGMALAGTCGFGALVRLGGGSLRALIVLLVLGLSALAAQRGIVGNLRIAVVDNLAIDLSFAGDQSLGGLASAVSGVDLRIAVALLASVLLFWWVLRDGRFRRERDLIVAGSVIGAAIAFGWLATALAARHSFEPVQLEAGSFVVPVGDTILQAIAFTGTWPDYGIGLVLGVVVGAALCAWRRADIRWEACDDARELSRHLAGGFLMGTGGVFALGCTIGQGISAVSVLALSAPVAIVSIMFGARLGLAYLIEGSLLAAFRRNAAAPAE
ncbi:YeeE/YedE family protein [Nitratireductor pacificus]|uniref:SoxT protein n=1 Tax=Nitratireductor pacificus pht-3B TaxID=391937 RepID=K2M8N5_9HYPH|nr:YeeE/YedE family protein [Nitratireductor pacificus]EKF17360.1 SoxT protein [Nitratireductor pacificus pht-3B]